MIPYVDCREKVEDLMRWGWTAFKIETMCGLSDGYVSLLRAGRIGTPSHDKAVRIYNFWESEARAREVTIPPYSSVFIST